jgi:hypothetical protein
MDIRVDGNRSSRENWARAQTAPVQELPALTAEQRMAADRLGLSSEAYARSFYAGELERKVLEGKAEQAAQLIEKLAEPKFPGLKVVRVWLKTFDGKFRFDVNFNGSEALIFAAEDLIDELLERGSKAAEDQIERVIELSLPAGWRAKAS